MQAKKSICAVVHIFVIGLFHHDLRSPIFLLWEFRLGKKRAHVRWIWRRHILPWQSNCFHGNFTEQKPVSAIWSARSLEILIGRIQMTPLESDVLGDLSGPTSVSIGSLPFHHLPLPSLHPAPPSPTLTLHRRKQGAFSPPTSPCTGSWGRVCRDLKRS